VTVTVTTEPTEPTEPTDEIKVADMLEAYEAMVRIRRFDLKAYEAYAAGHVRGGIHSYVGQEAIATGVCLHLRPDDFVNSYHRGHGHSLAKGTDPAGMMKELLGRSGGTSGGKGGSMHIADFGVGMAGANGIVADGAPMAVGVGHAIRMRGGDQVSVVFFGDGAVNRGPLLEALNWAAAFELPVLFVCEDNQFAAATRSSTVSAGPGFPARAEAMGVGGATVDGNDVADVWATAGRLLRSVRSGGGPAYVYAPTYRHFSHNIRSPFPMDESERAMWLAKDPLGRARVWLEDHGIPPGVIDDIDSAQEQVMVEALEAALAAPEPEPGQAFDDVQDHGGPRP
jgi:pyruvate dehydrogenase E1 component alpha subunit